MILDFGGWFSYIINRGIMAVIGGLYELVGAMYNVFVALSKLTNVISEDKINTLIDNIYIIMGVIVLFVVAYNLLVTIVDPDKSSSETSSFNMLKNIVITFLIIVLLPTAFRFAGGITSSLVEQGTFERLFNPDKDADAGEYDPGTTLGISVFSAFLYSEKYDSENKLYNAEMIEHVEGWGWGIAPDVELKCPEDLGSKLELSDDKCTLSNVIEYCKKTETLDPLFDFAANLTNNYSSENDALQHKVDFMWPLAFVGGIYLLIILIRFCFDLAVRIIKIAFYQIVAPLCVACRLLPKQKGIFEKWRSLILKAYSSVFIRILAFSLCVYFLSSINEILSLFNNDLMEKALLSSLVKLFIIFGILTFTSQLPKYIEEILGEETGLGTTIKDHLKSATAGGAVGALVSAPKAIKKAATGAKKVGSKVLNGTAKTTGKVASAIYSGKRAKNDGGSFLGGALASTLFSTLNDTGNLGLNKVTKPFKDNINNAIRDASKEDARRQKVKDYKDAKANYEAQVEDTKFLVNLKGKLEGMNSNEQIEHLKTIKDENGKQRFNSMDDFEKALKAATDLEDAAFAKTKGGVKKAQRKLRHDEKYTSDNTLEEAVYTKEYDLMNGKNNAVNDASEDVYKKYGSSISLDLAKFQEALCKNSNFGTIRKDENGNVQYDLTDLGMLIQSLCTEDGNVKNMKFVSSIIEQIKGCDTSEKFDQLLINNDLGEIPNVAQYFRDAKAYIGDLDAIMSKTRNAYISDHINDQGSEGNPSQFEEIRKTVEGQKLQSTVVVRSEIFSQLGEDGSTSKAAKDTLDKYAGKIAEAQTKNALKQGAEQITKIRVGEPSKSSGSDK